MDTNIIYNIDCVAGMNQMIDEASIDLIIADPPYFKVIGEKWDYLWRTEEDYLEWSEKWIAEAARVLRMGVKAKLFCPEIAGLFCRIAGLFCHDSRANLSLKPVCFGIAIS